MAQNNTSNDQQETDERNIEANSDTVRSVGFPQLLRVSHGNDQIEANQNTFQSIRSREEMIAAMHQMEEGNSKAIEIAWESITVQSGDGARTLLQGASGVVHGRFLAIMGPSGSGKTTLMNVLACRANKIKLDGEMRLNGVKYSLTELKQVSGYVMQDDLLNAYFTVQETLSYTAELRLPPSMTLEERNERVDEVIKKLGLEKCRNTIVGDPLNKGISGGERKRLCVAMELLNRPKLLFLDEPTSGLDSVTALSLCQALKDLTRCGDCTIITTIHQPQSRIFHLFDDILLLKGGRIVYYGPTEDSLRFFAECGFPCPQFSNPADHMLDVIQSDEHESDKDPSGTLMQRLKLTKVDVENGARLGKLQALERLTWSRQFRILFRRSLKEQFRARSIIITLLAQNIIMAFLIGGVFFQIGDTQSSTVRRQPVLFFCVINQGMFAALSIINSFPSERLLVLRERAAGTYQASSYFLAKNLAEAIMQLICPIVFSVIVYFMVGLQASFDKFIIFMTFMVLCSFAATSLALAISALARTTSLSVTILPMALEIARLYGGFFLSPANLPKYFAWIDALSYVKYTYVGVSLNELTGLTLKCKSS
ncbi:P-loop containing nucleoside triphosphate hydrolase protein [Paraphysoderma sedebokerense]|nr:P-loop containing nucleoside triphosphate hydrolase protein [Paraphysoderma sedebokerense]